MVATHTFDSIFCPNAQAVHGCVSQMCTISPLSTDTIVHSDHPVVLNIWVEFDTLTLLKQVGRNWIQPVTAYHVNFNYIDCHCRLFQMCQGIRFRDPRQAPASRTKYNNHLQKKDDSSLALPPRTREGKVKQLLLYHTN